MRQRDRERCHVLAIFESKRARRQTNGIAQTDIKQGIHIPGGGGGGGGGARGWAAETQSHKWTHRKADNSDHKMRVRGCCCCCCYVERMFILAAELVQCPGW